MRATKLTRISTGVPSPATLRTNLLSRNLSTPGSFGRNWLIRGTGLPTSSSVRLFATENAAPKEDKVPIDNIGSKDKFTPVPKDYDPRKVFQIDDPENIPPKIMELAQQVVKLNNLETIYFVRATAKLMGLTFDQVLSTFAAGPAPAATQQAAPTGGEPAAAAGAAKKEEPKKAEKATVTIKLIKCDEGSKYKILKEIRNLKPGMNLTESKTLVDNIPSVLKEGVPKEEAAKWAEKIKAAGGEVAFE